MKSHHNKVYLAVSTVLVGVLLGSGCSKKSSPAPAVQSSYGLTTTFDSIYTVQNIGSNILMGPYNDFNAPTALAVDAAGNLYLADGATNAIQKTTPGNSNVVTLAGGSAVPGSANGTGVAASFFGPMAIAVHAAGNVYVADTGNNLIRKVTPDGVVTTLAGSGKAGSADGSGLSASFNAPWGVAVDAAGNVYVSDSGNSKIRKITPAGLVTTLAGSGSIGKTDGTGNAASFRGPQGLAIDPSGNIYVADRNNNLIRKVTPSGEVTTVAGTGNSGSSNGDAKSASFAGPAAIAFDSHGNLYVADEDSSLIRKISTSGVVSTLAGSQIGFANGIGAAARFSWPEGIAVDKSDNVYIADHDNRRLRKIVAKQ